MDSTLNQTTVKNQNCDTTRDKAGHHFYQFGCDEFKSATGESKNNIYKRTVI